jgi:dimethylglycine dehydrogenase
MLRFGGRAGLRRWQNAREAHRQARLLSTTSVQRSDDLGSRWNSTADTVVIGGGIVGISTAYHLAKQSNQDVVLLEKTDLTAGSTWHAAGLTTTYHPGINVKKLHWYSMNFYMQLERETGQKIGMHQVGSLRLDTNRTRQDEFKYQMSRAGWNRAPQFLMTPEQIKERIPIIDIEGGEITGGLYSPLDGYVDPYSVTQAIAAGARKHGAKIYLNAEVGKMELQPDGSWEITTPKGSIRAKRIVNATGFWGREFSALADWDVPLCAIEHQYLVTKTVPELKQLPCELPVLRHLEGSFYLRMERDGLLIGPYESKDTMKVREEWARNKVPPGFGKELFPGDLDRLSPHLEVAMKILPCFEKAEIMTVVNGPITYSPDVLPLVGPTRINNLWSALGFSYGIIHGGGVGKYLADWILNGEPSYDLAECDPERYGKWTTLDYTLAKCREGYGMNNAIGYPHEERHAGRPTGRVNMIYDELVSAGAFMGFHHGWEQPDWYSADGSKPEYKPSFYRTNWNEAVRREHDLVMDKVGLIDLTPFSKFIVSGGDARRYLDYLVAGTVPKEGRTSIVHALTPGGKVMAEFTLTGMDKGRFMVVTGAGVEGHDLRHMEKVARDGKYDISIENVTDELNVLSIQGPNAGKVLAKLVGQEAVDGWKFLDAKEVKIEGQSVFAVRISYSGELGWEFYIARQSVSAVYKSLLAAGKDFGIGHFGTFALDAMRIEKGFKMWGNEMNLDVDALEAGLQMFIRMKKKSDFIGKAALLAKSGDFREMSLTMLEVDVTNTDPEGNHSVYMGGKPVGNTTSGCYSPTLGKGLVFAYVPSIVDFPGNVVEIDM